MFACSDFRDWHTVLTQIRSYRGVEISEPYAEAEQVTDSFVQRIHAELAAVQRRHTVLFHEASTVDLLSTVKPVQFQFNRTNAKETDLAE